MRYLFRRVGFLLALFVLSLVGFVYAFTDVDPNSYAYPFIMAIKERGITKGYPDGTYRPEEPVTKGAMAAFIIRAKFGTDDPICDGGIPCSQTKPYFQDVPTSYPFFSHIQKLKEIGVTKGYPDGTYRPEESIKRDAMAAFLVRAITGTDDPICNGGIPCSQTQPYFQDVPPNHPFFRHIQKLKELGITKGCNPEGTMYCPNSYVKRDQMAIFLGRAFLGLKEEFRNPVQGFLYAQAYSTDEKLYPFLIEIADFLNTIMEVKGYSSYKITTELKKLNSKTSLFSSNEANLAQFLKIIKPYLSTQISKIKSDLKSKTQFETIQCSYGGSLDISGFLSESNFDLTIYANNCREYEDVVMNGKIRLYGNDTAFTATFGEGETPFTINEDNYKQDIKILLTIEYPSIQYGIDFLNFWAIVNGKIESEDTEGEYYFDSFNNFRMNISYYVEGTNNKFKLSGNFNGNIFEKNNINFKRLLFTFNQIFNNFQFNFNFNDIYSEFNIDGILEITVDPNICMGGKFSYTTEIPIIFNFYLNKFTQGKIRIKDLNTNNEGIFIFNPDGTLTVNVGGITEIYPDFESDWPGFCLI
jgi:hypothetical protein